MDKELKDMSFNEMIKEGVRLELDMIVKGESLRNRVWQVAYLAVMWKKEQSEK